VFFKRDHRNDLNMVEFFETDENIENYINNNILEEKFH
jgi:hypothetical protein